ncbi:MAG: PAS domain S-box protein [Myxococcota bacterium]
MARDGAPTVLVVEDDAAAATNLGIMLRGLGYAVPGHAASADEALERAAAGGYDLALVDIGGVDGIATAGRLRERFGLPVIFVTGHVDDQTIASAKLAQPVAYLHKPLTVATLRSAIEVSLHNQVVDRAERARAAAIRETEEVLRLTFEQSPIGKALVGLDGRFMRVNRALCEVVGYSAEELLGLTFADITHPDDLAADLELSARLERGELARYRLAKRYLRKDGRIAHVVVHASMVRDGGGRSRHVIAQIEDVTETHRLQTELARREKLYQSIVAHLPSTAVFLLDQELGIVSADGVALGDNLRQAGYGDVPVVGRRITDFVTGADADETVAFYRTALDGRQARREVRRGSRIFDVHALPLTAEHGQRPMALVVSHDVTERATMLDTVARDRAFLEAALANIEDGVALVDGAERMVLANPAFHTMFGLEPERLVGLGGAELAAHLAPLAEDPIGLAALLAVPLAQLGASAIEVVLARPRRRVVRRTVRTIETLTGTSHLLLWQDVTAERDQAAERERQLDTDALTGIPNRRALERAFAREAELAARRDSPLALAVIDIDHFKRVNDVLGHLAGDDVLRQVACELARSARTADTVARWGGEEFIALLAVPVGGAVAFCERARRKISDAVRVAGIDLITVSAGVVAIAPGEPLASAIARADERLYAAKRAGRNRVEQ